MSPVYGTTANHNTFIISYNTVWSVHYNLKCTGRGLCNIAQVPMAETTHLRNRWQDDKLFTWIFYIKNNCGAGYRSSLLDMRYKSNQRSRYGRQNPSLVVS